MTGGARLGDFADGRGVRRRLRAGGLSAAAAARQTPAFGRAAGVLRAAGHASGAPAVAFFVPGRIEVLGKHTDYAGGRSLTCAVERGFAAVAVPGAGRRVCLRALDMDAAEAFDLAADLPPRPGHWSAYGRAVARRLAQNFPGAGRGGADVAFVSDLPPAAGLSSGSALVVAVFLALSALNRLPAHPAYRAHIRTDLDLAHYLGCVENGLAFRGLGGHGGVGTFGGSEDHTAILCSEPGRLRLYRYAPTRFEQAVPVPDGYQFVIATSGVVAEKTGAAQTRYNRAARLAAAAAEAWRRATGRPDAHLGDAVRAPSFSRAALADALAEAPNVEFTQEALAARAAQFYEEDQEILPAAVAALASGELAAFGALVDRSQQAAERWLGNQIPETIFLARAARRLGAVAASAFGAGFGGSVWALVARSEAPAFGAAWAARYGAAFPDAAARAVFFAERAGPAAFALG